VVGCLAAIQGALFRVGVFAIKQRGVSDAIDEMATTFTSDLFTERGALGALNAEKTNLYQFMGAQLELEFGKERGRESTFAQFEGWIETLAEPAQLFLFRAG
tara:strand:- start:420 stop:725 length:306 start_codon:yes stop_codon:yes gene_type:complete